MQLGNVFRIFVEQVFPGDIRDPLGKHSSFQIEPDFTVYVIGVSGKLFQNRVPRTIPVAGVYIRPIDRSRAGSVPDALCKTVIQHMGRSVFEYHNGCLWIGLEGIWNECQTIVDAATNRIVNRTISQVPTSGRLAGGIGQPNHFHKTLLPISATEAEPQQNADQ